MVGCCLGARRVVCPSFESRRAPCVRASRFSVTNSRPYLARPPPKESPEQVRGASEVGGAVGGECDQAQRQRAEQWLLASSHGCRTNTSNSERKSITSRCQPPREAQPRATARAEAQGHERAQGRGGQSRARRETAHAALQACGLTRQPGCHAPLSSLTSQSHGATRSQFAKANGRATPSERTGRPTRDGAALGGCRIEMHARHSESRVAVQATTHSRYKRMKKVLNLESTTVAVAGSNLFRSPRLIAKSAPRACNYKI